MTTDNPEADVSIAFEEFTKNCETVEALEAFWSSNSTGIRALDEARQDRVIAAFRERKAVILGGPSVPPDVLMAEALQRAVIELELVRKAVSAAWGGQPGQEEEVIPGGRERDDAIREGVEALWAWQPDPGENGILERMYQTWLRDTVGPVSPE